MGILTGAGGTFSSGMDLKAFLKGETPSFPGRGLCEVDESRLAHSGLALADVSIAEGNARSKQMSFTVKLSAAEAARIDGAGPWRRFFNVTLPFMTPGIIAGALLAFTLSLDDYVITAFTSGQTTTFPLYIFGATRQGVPPEVNVLGTILLAGVLVLMALNVLLQRHLAQPVQVDGLGGDVGLDVAADDREASGAIGVRLDAAAAVAGLGIDNQRVGIAAGLFHRAIDPREALRGARRIVRGPRRAFRKATEAVAAAVLIAAGLIYFAVTRYGYHLIHRWPFLIR